MSYTKIYRRVDKHIMEHQEEATELVKSIMRMKGEKDSDLAILNQSTKQKVHRFMSGEVKNTLPEECHVYARSLGKVIRLSKDSEGREILTCGQATESVDELFQKFCSTQDDEERRIILTFEIPAAIRKSLNLVDNDLIIETKYRSKGFGDFGDFGDFTFNLFSEPHEIIFRDRNYKSAEFGILISSEGTNAMLGVWTNQNENFAKQYRKAVGMTDGDEEVFAKILKTHGGWIGSERAGQFIALTPIDIYSESSKIAANLDVFHYIFERFVCVLAGVGLVGGFEGTKTLLQKNDHEFIGNSGRFPEEVESSVLDSSERKCEVNPEHELFPGIDGKPYVKVLPFIPITEETTKRFDEKLSSKANAVVVCPLCAERLKHAEWSIKEGIIMGLYDRKIEGLRNAGMDVSRLDLLTWQKEAQKTSDGSDKITIEKESKVRIGSQLMLYANVQSVFNGEGTE